MHLFTAQACGFFRILTPKNKLPMCVFKSVSLTTISYGYDSVIWYKLEMKFDFNSILTKNKLPV
jgi:hypothetical protein